MEAIKFLKKSWKLGGLFEEKISGSALGEVVRERLEKGLSVPEEYVSYFVKKEIGRRSGKPGAKAD